MSRVAIYARYSTDLQNAASIEDQIRLCREFALREGWEVMETCCDKGMSGASIVRPGLQDLLNKARDQSFDLVLCEALDRLSRDQADVASLFKHLAFLDIGIFTLAEGKISELHVGLKGTMNALFLKDLADKTRRGLRGRIEHGRSGGGLAYGYELVNERDQNGERIRGARAINPEEADVICRIFEEYAAGKSPRSIARDLNAAGVIGPGGERWRDTAIRGHITRGTGILNNELYIGRLVWNRMRFLKDPKTGKRVSRLNPEQDWIVKDVPELRIVGDDLWAKVKARQHEIRHSDGISKTRASRFWERRRAKHLLTGLVHCGVCGARYAALGKDYIGCSSARGTGTCNNRKSIKRAVLEDVILDALKQHLMAPELVSEFIAAFNAETSKQQRSEAQKQKIKHRELEDVIRKLEGLYEAISDGLRTPGLLAKLEELEARKAALDREIFQELPSPPALHPNLAKLYQKLIEDLRASLLSPETRDEALDLLRSLIERIIVSPTDDGLSFELIGDITAMIEAAHNKKPASEGAGVLGLYVSSAKVVAGAGFEPATFRL